ncbi:hypothetical protein B1R45_05020 [Pseudomonas azotoformans]|nr:hypothetical protein B1R45_05020 [Pseudomonas azotoformans]
MSSSDEELQLDLLAAAIALEDIASDFFLASQQFCHLDHPRVMQRIRDLKTHADRLKAIANEVMSGRISRSKEYLR